VLQVGHRSSPYLWTGVTDRSWVITPPTDKCYS